MNGLINRFSVNEHTILDFIFNGNWQLARDMIDSEPQSKEFLGAAILASAKSNMFSESAFLEFFDFLVDRGAYVNYRDQHDYENILHYFAQFPRQCGPDFFRKLIVAGVDINALSRFGMKPYKYYKIFHRDMNKEIALMLKYGCGGAGTKSAC